jgi:hypothetical protein
MTAARNLSKRINDIRSKIAACDRSIENAKFLFLDRDDFKWATERARFSREKADLQRQLSILQIQSRDDEPSRSPAIFHGSNG